MPEAGRVGDKSHVPADSHGCKACPHSAEGPATAGSSNVFINNKAALRVGDTGKHASCCGPNSWTAAAGAPAVFFNGIAVHRKGDAVSHCGGKGKLVGGSPDVFIGNEVRSKKNGKVVLAMLVSAGATFAMVAPNQVLGTLLGEALPWAVFMGAPAGIAKLLNKSIPAWGTWLTAGLAGAAWITMHVVKIHGKTLAGYAHWYFTNVLDNWSDPGPRYDTLHCPIENEPVGALPIASERADAESKTTNFNVDVTAKFLDVLRHFQPVEYQYDDDYYPIAMEALLGRSKVYIRGVAHSVSTLGEYVGAIQSAVDVLVEVENQEKAKNSDRQGYIDVDDDYARDHSDRDSEPTVYGRVIRSAKNTLRLQYVHIRAGSYLPTKELYGESYEHEGDGEAATIVVTIKDGQVVFEKTETGGHGQSEPTTCPTVLSDPAPVGSAADAGTHRRPAIFIAHGSHAIAPTPGKRAVKLGVTDWYPERQGEGVIALLPKLVAASETNVRNTVFTKKVVWGAAVGSYPGHGAIPPGE